MASFVSVGARPHVLTVATPAHVAVHSNQTSFSTTHAPHDAHDVAPAVDTLFRPVTMARRFAQSSPSSRALQEHDGCGFVAQF